MKRPIVINFIIGIGIFTVVAVALYWIIWFTVPEIIQARHPEAHDYLIYVNFEQVFTLADGWLAVTALVGVLGLWKMRDWGFLFMLLAESAAIFLGLMDFLYDLQHNMFVHFISEAGIGLIIVLLLLILGPLEIFLLWRQHRLFIY